tara:strand:+ start:46 stop:285 length:240 start_codon:yes stop_codon:yes gene_type:complete
MRKTNLRIRNFFIIEDGDNEFYLSSIDNLEEWKKYDENNLEKIKGKNYTEALNQNMKQYQISSNVNFFDINEKSIKIIE